MNIYLKAAIVVNIAIFGIVLNALFIAFGWIGIFCWLGAHCASAWLIWNGFGHMLFDKDDEYPNVFRSNRRTS